MKFLFVTNEALSIDLAYRIKEENNEVRFYTQSKDEKDIGDGFVDKADQWEEFVGWADVVVFDDIGFGKAAEKLRSEGKRVVGGSTYTDRLENDREFGQKELESAGVAVLPSWNFTNFDEAIGFVASNPDRYVIKPSGSAQNEKELLFVGKEVDGNDIVQVLAHYKKNWSNKIRIFQLQKFANGVEVAVGAFFNGKDFVYPINVNFEHKRLFPGDIGPSTGEMGCYDEKTEVLTDSGWKLFMELTYGDRICTLRPEDHKIEFVHPQSIVCYDHHKRLVAIENGTIDLAVTQDHNMYVRPQREGSTNAGKFEFVKARDLGARYSIKRSGTWEGHEADVFVMPSLALATVCGGSFLLHSSPSVEIPMDDWLALLGLWTAAGSASGEGRVLIEVATCGIAERARTLLSRLPFVFEGSGGGFLCRDGQLYSFLVTLGGRQQRRIPRFAKDLSPRQIGIFLDWLALGCASSARDGSRKFYVASKRLGGEIQELLLKIGSAGTLGEGILTASGGSRCTAGDVLYEVVEDGRTDTVVDKSEMRVIEYGCKVYCATVKNHVMYVRRNGKPCWCGNTSMFWSQKNKLFELTLEKMKPKLAQAGHVGYIDINCIANNKGVYPLEFTSRFGYPTISIQMEGMTSGLGETFYKMAGGEPLELRVKKGFQVGVVIALPPFPFNDERTFRKYSEEATILFKKDNKEGVHLGEVKRSNGDWHVAGRSGYALVVTGSGTNMEDARRQAYNRVENIMIPNMFFRRDIGERWSLDSDMLLSWGYLY